MMFTGEQSRLAPQENVVSAFAEVVAHDVVKHAVAEFKTSSSSTTSTTRTVSLLAASESAGTIGGGLAPTSSTEISRRSVSTSSAMGALTASLAGKIKYSRSELDALEKDISSLFLNRGLRQIDRKDVETQTEPEHLSEKILVVSLEKNLSDLLSDLLVLIFKKYRQVVTGQGTVNFVSLIALANKVHSLIPLHSQADLLTCVPAINLDGINDIESQEPEEQRITLIRLRTWVLHLSQFI